MTMPQPRAKRFVIQTTHAGKVSGVRVPANEAYFWFYVTTIEQAVFGDTKRQLYRVEGSSVVKVGRPADIFILPAKK